MKHKYFFLFVVFCASLFTNAQTTTLPYSDYVYTSGNPSVTLNNFSTCQTSASITSNSQGFEWGNWVNKNYSLIVNGTNIGSFIGTQTIDISTYLPITSVQMNGLFSSWSWVDLEVNITSNNASMPATGPTVSNVTYVQGDTASPLSATLNSTGTTLKWYTDAFGDNYSATAPTPSTAAVGTTSYWVSQANASGCESVRSEIVVTVLPNTPATHLNFDGNNDVVNCGNNAIFNITSAITLESWIYPTAHGVEKTIISKHGDAAGNDSYILRLQNGLPFFIIKIAGIWYSVSHSSALSLNNWHHVSGVYDGATMKIFVNGVLMNSVTRTGAIQVSTSTFKIGGWNNASFKFTGSIDDVRVWNIARTENQIFGSKNCELQGSETGLVAYYNFNQGVALANNTTQTTLNATTGVNGTLSNFALTGSASNWLAGSPVTTGSITPSIATVSTPVVYNQGDTATALTATTGTNGTGLMWYTTATGGTGTGTAPTPSTTAAGSTSYWVASSNANGCESERTEIVVQVSAYATHLNFDGVDDAVTLGTNITNALNGSNYVTAEAWVKVPNTIGMKTIVGNHNSNGAQFNLRIDGDKLNGFLGFGAYDLNTTAGTITANTWYHVAMVYNDTTLKLYINGVESASMSIPVGYSLQNTVQEYRIGHSGYGNEFFNGSIDEVRIWNVALLQTDIQNLMNCELQSTESSVVGYYKFNQGFDMVNNSSVTSAIASVGPNGLLTNFALTGATSNWQSSSPIVTGNTCAFLTSNDFVISNKVKLFPNPTNGILNIELSQLTNSEVQLLDLNGRVLMNKTVSNSLEQIDLSGFNAAIYLLKITSNEGTATYKVVKQ